MWIFTTDGFFSAVMRDDKIVLRARKKAHLTRLDERYDLELVLEHTPKKDYTWRATISREVFEHLCRLLACDVTYPNFKAEAASRSCDRHYDDMLHDVWERSQR